MKALLKSTRKSKSAPKAIANNFDGGFQSVFFSAPDGLVLHARDYGRENTATQNRLPVLCLPGLTRNSKDFHKLALILSQDSKRPRRVVALDYRGRGRSAWDSHAENYNILTEAEDVMAAAAALGIRHAAFIGTSRGALLIHMLAALRPGIIAAAILNDAGPVVDGAGLAQIRVQLERSAKPRDWNDAAKGLKKALGKSFPALDEPDWHDMAHAIYREKKRGLEADCDPAVANMLRNIDFNTRLPTLWPQFDGLRNMPLMTIHGELSNLLSTQTLDEMRKHNPAMTVITAAGQGHAPILHLGGLDANIAAFLAAAEP